MKTDIGMSIKHARLIAHMEQQTLAAKVGCSRNHISSIETGACRPSLDLWLKIQQVLKMD
jgi:DNA-binding XRE family transcriptional regulator